MQVHIRGCFREQFPAPCPNFSRILSREALVRHRLAGYDSGRAASWRNRLLAANREPALFAADVDWDPTDSLAQRPPLDASLADWEVVKRRLSHLNASRSFNGRTYHLKWYFHRALVRNPARREFRNAKAVRDLGIPSVSPVGWGRHHRGTFLVMEGSPGVPIYRLPQRPAPPLLEDMARQLALIVARLHDANLSHRDLYLDHVLIHRDTVRLIDLGRLRRFRRRRWIIKDLGGLLFSAWRDGIPPHLARLFFRVYLAHSRRPWNRRRLVATVQRKARRYRQHNAP